MATKKFLEQGRRKIGLITTDDYLSVSKARTTGYQKALAESSLKANESWILRLPSMEMDEEAIGEFLDKIKPDAVLCVNEIFAVYSMRLAQQKGWKIPDDVSFIGFTDGVLSKYANPSLTVVAQHGELMGEVSAKMLIDKVENEEGAERFQTRILEPTLVIRESIVQ
jgi:LacI family transcriptional regulator